MYIKCHSIDINSIINYLLDYSIVYSLKNLHPSINKLEIEHINHIKHLSAIFGEKLKWNTHANYINYKIRKQFCF